jgi:hypothetical protein
MKYYSAVDRPSQPIIIIIIIIILIMYIIISSCSSSSSIISTGEYVDVGMHVCMRRLCLSALQPLFHALPASASIYVIESY